MHAESACGGAGRNADSLCLSGGAVPKTPNLSAEIDRRLDLCRMDDLQDLSNDTMM